MGGDPTEGHPLFEVYDELLVPLVFQAYAEDTVDRVADVTEGALLETAAGTGVITRLLAARLPAAVAITATDLVPGMLQRAEQVGTARPVTWEVADALDLPYADASFDVLVCGFGAMFFAPHADAFAEAHRVLRPGGRLVFSVWDRLEANELSWAVNGAMHRLFPDDPPGFLARTPYGYSDPDVIVADLAAGGFTATPVVERIGHRCRAATATDVARALCAGTPLRDELARRGPGVLDHAIEATAECLADRYGPRDLEADVAALFVTVTR